MKNPLNHSRSSNLNDDLVRHLSLAYSEGVVVSNLRRLTGGSSHDSWAFDAVVDDKTLSLILRRDFGDKQLDLDLATEFELLRRLHEAGLPVPPPLWTGGRESAFGAPFIISERFQKGDVRKLIASRQCDPQKMGCSIVDALVKVHALDWRVALNGLWADPGESGTLNAVRLLKESIADNLKGADPLIAASIDWLMCNAAKGGPIALVHGDFKTNNIVADENGNLALIDWELSHLGDPLEDIAWTMLWTTPHDLIGGLLSESDFIIAYETRIGRAIDRRRLEYWRLFSLVKLASIFAKSLNLSRSESQPRPMHLMLMRALPWVQAQLAEHLEKEAGIGGRG